MKYFLFIVGIMYITLALWCSLDPVNTSQTVGFDLIGGHGQSEFLTIYGGWEFAMGIVFILPLFKSHWAPYSLGVCLIMHACLVGFRSAGFFIFDINQQMTYNLAIGEWVIFILSVFFYVTIKKESRKNEKLA